jgi:hypothetical protein
MADVPAPWRPALDRDGLRVFEATPPLECLPCPFCGGTRFKVQASERFQDAPWGEREAWAFHIRCLSCATEGPWNKTSDESACRQWNRRSIHGLDLAQFEGMPAERTTCPDCGLHPLFLGPRHDGLTLLGSAPYFWICGCGAIRQANNPTPISPSRRAKRSADAQTAPGGKA